MLNFLRKKNAQGLSLHVIIIALLGIIIMVVLIMIFTGKTKFFSKHLANCEAKGGTCLENCDANHVEHYGTDCASREDERANGPHCCETFA